MSDDTLPAEPELQRAQRARIVFDYDEDGEHHHCTDNGWARIDGPWVLFFSDEIDSWSSWPMARVTCIDWAEPPS